jgi:hypothetical protein
MFKFRGLLAKHLYSSICTEHSTVPTTHALSPLLYIIVLSFRMRVADV